MRGHVERRGGSLVSGKGELGGGGLGRVVEEVGGGKLSGVEVENETRLERDLESREGRRCEASRV